MAVRYDYSFKLDIDELEDWDDEDLYLHIESIDTDEVTEIDEHDLAEFSENYNDSYDLEGEDQVKITEVVVEIDVDNYDNLSTFENCKLYITTDKPVEDANDLGIYILDDLFDGRQIRVYVNISGRGVAPGFEPVNGYYERSVDVDYDETIYIKDYWKCQLLSTKEI